LYEKFTDKLIGNETEQTSRFYNLHRRPLGRAGASYFTLDAK